MAVANIDDPSALSHLIAGSLRIKTEEKQELLEERDVAKRLRRLSEILARELEVAAMGARIQSQVQSELDKSQREYLLREQLKAIQEELGERDPAEAEVEELREQLAAIELPEEVRKVADRELSRLEKLPQAAAEHGVIRTYLEWIASLPWGSRPRTTSTSSTRASSSTPTTTTSSASRTASSSSSPCGGSSPTRAARSSASSGRRASARRRSGRSIAARAGAQVRAHLGRRHARRGGDPRPPPHLHRRDAGRDRPRAARRRRQQPGLHDRRDRQDGRGLPRRPGVGDARGARPGAERRLPRPLPRHRRSTSRA